VPDARLADVVDGPEATAEGPSGAQAVERALALLGCFEEADELRLTDLARRTGLRPSTAYRILRALCRNGYVAQDPGSERYRLGVRTALLGRRAAGALGLDAAQPVLDALAVATGESTALGIGDGTAAPGHVVMALVASSPQRLRFDHIAGDRVRAHASAIGKVLLAFAGDDPADVAARLGALERYTDRTIVEPAALAAELGRVRRRGYAVNHAERYDAVVAVAAPVLDAGGRARAGVGIQGPATRLTTARLRTLAADATDAAARLAAVLPLDRL
jgi:IclR family acetate operon transcriptional repressor